jgi:hypothetical protein
MVLPENVQVFSQRVKGIRRRDRPGGKLSSTGNLELEEASHLAHAGMGHAHRHGVDTASARQQVIRDNMKLQDT